MNLSATFHTVCNSRQPESYWVANSIYHLVLGTHVCPIELSFPQRQKSLKKS